MKEKDEIRKLLKPVVEKEKERQTDGTYKTSESKEMSRVLVALMEKSDFGRKNAEEEFFVPADRMRFGLDAIDSSCIDGLLIEGMRTGNTLLGTFGEVSVAPYSRGIDTKSGKYTFVARH